MRLPSLLRRFLLLLSPSSSLSGCAGVPPGLVGEKCRREVPPAPKRAVRSRGRFRVTTVQRRGLKDDMPPGSRCRQVVNFFRHVANAANTFLGMPLLLFTKFCAGYLGRGADPLALRPARTRLSFPPTSLVACHSRSAAARSRRAPSADSQCHPSTMTDLTTCPVESGPCPDRA